MHACFRRLALTGVVFALSAAGIRASQTPSTQPTTRETLGSREDLLRQVAKAWAGTPYRNHGTTFEGIGNPEFVREIYGAAYDADLPGDAARWRTAGAVVDRKGLEPGDLIFYDADPLTHFKKELNAGVYIGGGEFVASVKGSTVAILKLGESRWKSAFQTARRIEPAPRAGSSSRSTTIVKAPASAVSNTERRLRDLEEEWHGTPYRLGGASKSGIDCSAFSRVLYSEIYHVELPRTVEEQEKIGASVPRSKLQAGDLVFFRTRAMGPRSGSRHVGVYLGHNEFAQASGSRGVTISRLDDPYWNERYRTARRVK